MLVVPMALFAPVFSLFLLAAGATEAAVGLAVIALALGLYGFLNGPMDIAMFTIRQRRTEQAWMGRAFAVSMAFNFVGFPVGAALAGILAAHSIEAAVVLGIGAALVGTTLAATLVPRQDPASIDRPDAATGVGEAA